VIVDNTSLTVFHIKIRQ